MGDCVKYVEATDAKGNIRMVAQPEREFTIAGLVSDVPYEFRVAAVNEVGQGVWSDVSVPIVMNNPDRVSTVSAVTLQVLKFKFCFSVLLRSLLGSRDARIKAVCQF